MKAGVPTNSRPCRPKTVREENTKKEARGRNEHADEARGNASAPTKSPRPREHAVVKGAARARTTHHTEVPRVGGANTRNTAPGALQPAIVARNDARETRVLRDLDPTR